MRSSFLCEFLGVFAFLVIHLPRADAFINFSPSTLTLAKKVKVEFEVDLPDGSPDFDIPSLEQTVQAIQAWKTQTAETYPFLVQSAIRTSISTIKELANNEELVEVKQKLDTVSKDYNKAISEPFQKVISEPFQKVTEKLSALQPEIEKAKVYNTQVAAPSYKEALNKLFLEQTYAAAKENNQQAVQDYKSALSKAYSFLQDVYPKETIASVVAQQKVNNEVIIQGYNKGFSKLVQGLQPAKETTQELAVGYKQFATKAYGLFNTVAAPVAKQSSAAIQSAKVANVQLESQYKDFVTHLYQDSVKPGLSTVSKALSEAYTTASTEGLEQTKAAQADALIKYNAWITQTYSQLVEAYDESGAKPVLEDFASKLQGQLDEAANQVISNLPSFIQSQALDDFAFRMDVSSMIHVDAVANVAAQYQHFLNNLQDIVNSGTF